MLKIKLHDSLPKTLEKNFQVALGGYGSEGHRPWDTDLNANRLLLAHMVYVFFALRDLPVFINSDKTVKDEAVRALMFNQTCNGQDILKTYQNLSRSGAKAVWEAQEVVEWFQKEYYPAGSFVRQQATYLQFLARAPEAKPSRMDCFY